MAMISDFPRILSQNKTRLSDWVTLTTKLVAQSANQNPAEYHSFAQHDYVSVFAITPAGMILLVRQFRPAVDRYTYEFPGGLLDRHDTPEDVAVSEVWEETGYRISGKPILLGCMAPDTGRLENRFWGFFAETEPSAGSSWVTEKNIEALMVDRSEFKEMIGTGQFDHALHIALIGLALTKGLFSWEE